MKWLLSFAISLVAVGVLATASSPRAATPPSSLGGVIYAVDLGTPDRPLLQLSPTDGRVLGKLPCSGNISYGGSPREFLVSGVGGDRLTLNGQWLLQTALYVVPESGLVSPADCTAGDLVLDDPSIYGASSAKWSHDGTHVAFAGARVIATGVESGIWVARVANLSGDRSLVELELAVPLDVGLVQFSWSYDDKRIAFAMATGTPVQSDIFVADLLTGTVVNVTNSAANEYSPEFAPKDNRIAFSRPTDKAGNARGEIYVLSGGTVTQVTNKSNANAMQIDYPSWSPDGSQIAFRGYVVTKPDILRIGVSGKDKAVNLTGKSSISFSPPAWRP